MFQNALQGFTHFLKGQCLKWYTDNKGVATIVKSRGTQRQFSENICSEKRFEI